MRDAGASHRGRIRTQAAAFGLIRGLAALTVVVLGLILGFMLWRGLRYHNATPGPQQLERRNSLRQTLQIGGHRGSHGTRDRALPGRTTFLRRPRRVLPNQPFEELVVAEQTEEGAPAQGERDETYQRVIDFAESAGEVSISSIQRRFKVGYNKAARLMDLLAEDGPHREFIAVPRAGNPEPGVRAHERAKEGIPEEAGRHFGRR